jgi:hypothetical protein
MFSEEDSNVLERRLQPSQLKTAVFTKYLCNGLSVEIESVIHSIFPIGDLG